MFNMLLHVALVLAAGKFVHGFTVVEAGLFMRKNIDPIVVPGQYKSHMHSFFGSDAVTLNTSTSKQLQAGCTTAHNYNDFSAYWLPTLYLVQGSSYTPVPFFRFSAYYVDINNAEIPYPPNLKMLAGNTNAKSQAEINPLAKVEWICTDDPYEIADDAAFPTKTCSSYLQNIFVFPNCVNLATMAYAYSGTHNWTPTFQPVNECPAGMKRMPRLRFSIRYDLRKLLPGGWSGPPPLELACGSSYCSHGDFINGWLPEAAQDMMKSKSKTVYNEILGPLGGDSLVPVCKNPKDADPTRGTSDYLTSKKLLGQ